MLTVQGPLAAVNSQGPLRQQVWLAGTWWDWGGNGEAASTDLGLSLNPGAGRGFPPCGPHTC